MKITRVISWAVVAAALFMGWQLIRADDTLYLIYLHGPQGNLIGVNVLEISTIREPTEGASSHLAPGTKCTLVMANGQFNLIAETCQEVVRKIAALGAAYRPAPQEEGK